MVCSACLFLLVVTTVIHYEVLRFLSLPNMRTRVLSRLGIRPRMQLIFVIFGAFAAHATEIMLYGLAYFLLATNFDVGTMGQTGTLPFSRCVYFSAETFTSLGYGDVVPHGELRLLAGMEALNGLLLIGWTGSYTYLSMQRFWGEQDEKNSQEKK
jgi:voltage-gated potassium channel Kch